MCNVCGELRVFVCNCVCVHVYMCVVHNASGMSELWVVCDVCDVCDVCVHVCVHMCVGMCDCVVCDVCSVPNVHYVCDVCDV